MTTELIPLQKTTIDGQQVTAVNARELHAFLEVNARFNDWITNRIDDFNFVENQDFICFTKNLVKPQGGRPSKEYYVSLDMAKELAMLERNDKGKQARRYFICCEKKLKTIESKGFAPQSVTEEKIRSYFMLAQYMVDTEYVTLPIAKAYALDAIHEDTGLLTNGFRKLLPAIAPKDQAYLNATQIGLKVNLSAVSVNKRLAELNLIKKVGKNWLLTKEGAKHGEAKPYSRHGHSGYDVKWRESVLTLLPNIKQEN